MTANIKIIRPEVSTTLNRVIRIVKMERTEVRDMASGLGVRARVVTVWALVDAHEVIVSEHATKREAVMALQQYRVK